ncbi:MAG: hypothetical protein ACJA1A_001158 [Saprospiraceae bacterium]|jgi:hypothetical protein
MNKSLLTIFFLVFTQVAFSQSKQDYHWFLGIDQGLEPGVNAYKIDFNDNPPTFKNSDNGLGIGGQATSISSKNGDLLFSSNGCAVLNKNAEVMPHGDTLNYDEWYELAWDGSCIYGYPGFQDILILYDPANDDGYHIIHKANIFNGFGTKTTKELRHSYVDMSLNDNLGDVVYYDRSLVGQDRVLSSYLTAINHTNGRDWWIMQGLVNDSSYITFLLDEIGLSVQGVQNSHQYFNTNRSSASGVARFSPDGTKYAVYNWYDQLHVYDFDRSSGQLSNHQKIEVFAPDEIDTEEIRFSSLEWSSNSRFIYTASLLELHQIDMWEENPQNGIRLIDTYNGTLDPFTTTFFMLSLAPDCKIYLAPKNGTNSYHIIKNPNELGTACNFVQNGIKLPRPSGIGSFLNFPRFRVDEEEKCDPTLTSVFGDAVYYRRDLNVYPSPSDGRYTIEVPDGFRSGTLSVLNLDGQVVESKVVSGGTLSVSIDITRYPSGYYHVELYSEENEDRVFWSRQVVKE